MTVRIISAEGKIEESAGRRKFWVVPDGRFMDYEKKMLCSSGCPYTLPMYFLTIDGTERVYYDFTGFLQLEDYIRRSSEDGLPGRDDHKLINDALDVLSKIMDSIKGMENYLLFPERFSIHPDAVFVHSNGQVSYAFFPNENPDGTLQGRIIDLIENLIGLYRDVDVEQYLLKFKDLIYKKNPGLDGMIGILGTIKREVSYIYWNTKNFRIPEEYECSPLNEKNGRNQKDGNTSEMKCQGKKEKQAYLKPLAIQTVLAAGLIAAFLSGFLELTSFAGLAALAAGADLWLMRKLHYI